LAAPEKACYVPGAKDCFYISQSIWNEAECEPMGGTLYNSMGECHAAKDNPKVSSSSEVASSSSAVSPSSNSVAPEPVISGKFEFRLFAYSSSGSRIYFFGTSSNSNMRESQILEPPEGSASSANSGKLLNTLAITAAAGCVGDIIVESTLDGAVFNIPKSGGPAGSGATVDRAGPLVSKAYAMCDGVKKLLATTEAEVVANPSWGDCKLPTYVQRSEAVQNVVHVNNDYGRCGNVTYNNPNQNYPSTATAPATTSFSTTARCSNNDANIETKTCSGIITVATNYYKYTAIDTSSPINAGTTIVEVLDAYGGIQVNRFGCQGNFATNNSSNTFTYKLNNGVSVGPDYWVETQIPSYTANGNRFLVQATEDLSCLVTKY